MNAKNIFRNIRGLAMSALLLIPAAFVSCSDDDTEGGSPYFRLENTVVSSKLVTASSDLGSTETVVTDVDGANVEATVVESSAPAKKAPARKKAAAKTAETSGDEA